MSDLIHNRVLFELACALAASQRITHEFLVRANLATHDEIDKMLDAKIHDFIRQQGMVDAANMLRLIRQKSV